MGMSQLGKLVEDFAEQNKSSLAEKPAPIGEEIWRQRVTWDDIQGKPVLITAEDMRRGLRELKIDLTWEMIKLGAVVLFLLYIFR